MAVTNDIVKTLAKKTGQPVFRAKAYLKGVTDIIAAALAEGDKVELSGFGEFKLLRLPARKVQANLGGKKRTINLAATTTPDFVVDANLQSQVGSPKEAPQTDVTQEFRAQDVRVGLLQTRKSDVQFIELGDKTIPKEILSKIPEALARKYQAVPFALQDKTLFVAMTDPENEEAFNALRKSSGKIIKPFITTQDDVGHVLDQYTSLQADLSKLVESSEELETVEEEQEAKESDDQITETSPAAKIVASLLKRSVREKASDIHIEPLEEEVQVRFRIDGVLRKVLTLPKQVQMGIVSRIKILSNMKIDETRLPQDGRIQIMLDGDKVDFRISTLPTVNGEKVVARVLLHSKGVMSFEEQGLQGRNLNWVNENIKKAHGMILVTGPTGSGKSTTLYAIINKIKSDDINIITMEDPVEYRMPQVNQSQVNAKIEFTFASGLRSILRQDPDVVMVGEIRDRETADIAINAALTGHIVLSTLHTNDSGGAIPRLLDMGIEPFLITSSLNAVVGQRLCRKICDKCRHEADLKPEDLDTVKKEIETLPEPEKSEARKGSKFYAGQGCDACSNSGYRGRIGIFEVLNISETIKQLTLKHASTSEIMVEARKQGLITMKQDGILKALQGLTTIEEVWRVARD